MADIVFLLITRPNPWPVPVSPRVEIHSPLDAHVENYTVFEQTVFNDLHYSLLEKLYMDEFLI